MTGVSDRELPDAGGWLAGQGKPRWLLLVLALAVTTRLGWWLAFDRVIELNGVDYVRLAENIYAGEGYVASYGGPHVLYPPLYPLLIGLVAQVAGDFELAARLVSLLAGLATVVLIAAIVDRLAGRRAAWIAALLAACHPLAVAFSVAVYTEPLWMALISGAILLALRGLEQPGVASGVGIGLLTGLAYLTRPEGLVYALALTGLVTAATLLRQRQRGPAIRLGLGALVAFLVVAAPYMAFLSLQAGEFHWEGKSGANNILSARMRDGMSYAEAARGLDADAKPVGIYLLRDQRILLRYETAGTGELLSSLLARPGQRLVELTRRVAHADFIGKPLLLFAALGIAATGWWRTRPRAGTLLVMILVLQVALLASLEFTWSRFLVSFLPVLLVWAATGIGAAAGWAQRVFPADSARWSWVLAGVLAALVCIPAARGTYHLYEIRQGRMVELREAGTIIAADFRRLGLARRPEVLSASASAPVSHYSGAVNLGLPYAEESLALRYLHRVRPDYIVLRSLEKNDAPFVADWVTGGIDDTCAQPVWESRQGTTEHIRVWRWACAQ